MEVGESGGKACRLGLWLFLQCRGDGWRVSLDGDSSTDEKYDKSDEESKERSTIYMYPKYISSCTTPKAVPDIGEGTLIMLRPKKVMGHLRSPLS